MKVSKFGFLSKNIFALNESNGLKLYYYAFDWDDNILNMPTKILMDKKEGANWKPVQVSTSNFTIFRNDPEYRLRNDDPNQAYSEFRDIGPRGSNAFLEDCKIALRENKKAPSWNSFLECLSSGSIFSIITARGHGPEAIRKGVEYIIDNILTDLPSDIDGILTKSDEMYENLKKFAYFFKVDDSSIPNILKGDPSKNKLIKDYLDHCFFFGVSSPYFLKKFNMSGDSRNPEKLKERALDFFISKCNYYGHQIGANLVSIGFSDDDIKNLEKIKVFFHEKNEFLKAETKHDVKLSIFDTTDPTLKGGRSIKLESSNQAPGLENSVIPFTKWNNMTQSLYPNSRYDQTNDYQNRFLNNVNQSDDLNKKFKPKKIKKIKMRYLKKFESFDDSLQYKSKLIDDVYNLGGYDKDELEGYSIKKLQMLLNEPESMSRHESMDMDHEMDMDSMSHSRPKSNTKRFTASQVKSIIDREFPGNSAEKSRLLKSALIFTGNA